VFTLDISKVDLTKLIGGPPLIVLYTLTKNRIRVDFNILIDTRVNRFVFIDIDLIEQLYKGLGLLLTPLDYTITIKGYNSYKGTIVTYYLSINLTINRCY